MTSIQNKGSLDGVDILEYRKDQVLQNSPKAILAAFKWAIQGNIGPAVSGRPNGRCCAVSLQTHQDDLFNAVKQFLLQEQYDASPESEPASEKDVLHSLRILKETTRYVEERYEAGVLWAKDDAVLPDNRQDALERFNGKCLPAIRSGQRRLQGDGAEFQSRLHRESV